MKTTQIIGIIFLISGVLTLGYSAINFIQLMIHYNDPLVNMGIGMSGYTKNDLMASFTGIAIGGFGFITIGIIFMKQVGPERIPLTPLRVIGLIVSLLAIAIILFFAFAPPSHSNSGSSIWVGLFNASFMFALGVLFFSGMSYIERIIAKLNKTGQIFFYTILASFLIFGWITLLFIWIPFKIQKLRAKKPDNAQ